MTFEEYNKLKSNDKLYSFKYPTMYAHKMYSHLSSVVDEHEICEQYFKDPSLGFSFSEDVTHIGISKSNYKHFYLTKKEALIHKIDTIVKTFKLHSNEIIDKDRYKKFFKQKNIRKIILEKYPELLIL